MKALVIGDICRDIFVYGNCERISPEAPIPVLSKTSFSENMGMAGNVVSNLKYFKCDVDLISNKESITKTRYVDSVSNYILLRVDDEPKISPINFSSIPSFKNYDFIIISDYNKGFLSTEDIEKILKICKNEKIITFMDTKKVIGDWAKDCSFIKINEKEYNNKLHKKYLEGAKISEKLIVTLGSRGSKHNGRIIPTEAVQVRDVSGAGDTYLAGLAVYFCKTKDIFASMKFANKCARSVVSQPGVSTPKDMEM